MTDGIRLPIASAPPITTAHAPAAPSASASGSSFREALHDAAREMASHEVTLDRVLSRRGAPLSPEQLLALQATVHRYSQEVELAAKLTDKLTGAVRQVLTSQQ